MDIKYDRESRIIVGDLMTYKRLATSTTQRDLALRFGLSHQVYISEIERGFYLSPTQTQAVSAFLEFSPEELESFVQRIIESRQLIIRSSGIEIIAETDRNQSRALRRFYQDIAIIKGPEGLSGDSDFIMDSYFGLFKLRNVNTRFLEYQPPVLNSLRSQVVLPYRYYEDRPR